MNPCGLAFFLLRLEPSGLRFGLLDEVLATLDLQPLLLGLCHGIRIVAQLIGDLVRCLDRSWEGFFEWQIGIQLLVRSATFPILEHELPAMIPMLPRHPE